MNKIIDVKSDLMNFVLNKKKDFVVVFVVFCFLKGRRYENVLNPF